MNLMTKQPAQGVADGTDLEVADSMVEVFQGHFSAMQTTSQQAVAAGNWEAALSNLQTIRDVATTLNLSDLEDATKLVMAKVRRGRMPSPADWVAMQTAAGRANR